MRLRPWAELDSEEGKDEQGLGIRVARPKRGLREYESCTNPSRQISFCSRVCSVKCWAVGAVQSGRMTGRCWNATRVVGGVSLS